MKYLTCLQLMVLKGCRKILNAAKKCMDLMQVSQPYRYSDQMIHPMAIAVSQYSSNRKLLSVLERIGFDYSDCSSILQTAIQVSDQRVIIHIMDKLAKMTTEWDYLSESATHKSLALPMRVMSKWRALAYLQQPTKQKATALHQAVDAVDLECVKLLLDRCRSTQLLDGLGRLDWIVFRRTGATTEEQFNLEDIKKYSELRKYCEEMIQSIIDGDVLNISLLTEAVTSNCRVFYSPVKEDIGTPFTKHLDKVAHDIDNFQFGNPIPDFINDDPFRMMHLTIFVKTGLYTKCAVKLNTGFCMIFALLDGNANNKSFVNFITENGQTPLHGCFPDATEKSLELKSRLKNNIGKPKTQSAKLKKEATNRDFTGDAKKILQLLCSEGANPLLMQNAMALAGIHFSFQYTADRTVALFLIDHCIKNELRCSNGANLWEHDDGDGNTLLHHAIMCDRLDVMKVLIEKKVKINVQNCVGLTPAMMAVCGGLHNPTEAVRHLLEADVSTLNARNVHQRTLLHYSVLRPGSDILGVLLDYTPDFSIKDRQGNTPFREALLRGHVVWVETALNFALSKKIHVTNSIDDIMAIITKSKFDVVASKASNYFYFAFGGDAHHNEKMDEGKIVADLQAHATARLASYLKLITVGH
uniref:ANK_REP_REGION domain-containing protein n=1 Tax=Anopheles albimanus TaxID=7167 RepID=A0A182FYD7_ANOAL